MIAFYHSHSVDERNRVSAMCLNGGLEHVAASTKACHLMVSADQEFGNNLAGWLWLWVSRKVTGKMIVKCAVF